MSPENSLPEDESKWYESVPWKWRLADKKQRMKLSQASDIKPIRLGINGFGRIGRAITRILRDDARFVLAAINDVAEDVANLTYLLNYDSVYGRMKDPARLCSDSRAMEIGDRQVPVYCKTRLDEVPWADDGVQVVVDSSGVGGNIAQAQGLVKDRRLSKVIVTHSPSKGVDFWCIMGVNDDAYDAERHHVISSSICDANAMAHVFKALDEGFGIVGGSVTTLHPWLSYQNLVDAPVASQSNPGHFWKDYSLGRACTGVLIPKKTTAVSALKPILGELVDGISSFSYRVPTPIVSSADMNLILDRTTTSSELRDFLEKRFEDSPYVSLNVDSLTSIDYLGECHSAVLDLQWLQVSGGKLAKVIAWYDNEWGYSCRVRDLIGLIGGADPASPPPPPERSSGRPSAPDSSAGA